MTMEKRTSVDPTLNNWLFHSTKPTCSLFCKKEKGDPASCGLSNYQLFTHSFTSSSELKLVAYNLPFKALDTTRLWEEKYKRREKEVKRSNNMSTFSYDWPTCECMVRLASCQNAPVTVHGYQALMFAKGKWLISKNRDPGKEVDKHMLLKLLLIISIVSIQI